MNIECLHNDHIGTFKDSGYHVCDRCGLHEYYDNSQELLNHFIFKFGYDHAGKGAPNSFVISISGGFFPCWNNDDEITAIAFLERLGKEFWVAQVSSDN